VYCETREDQSVMVNLKILEKRRKIYFYLKKRMLKYISDVINSIGASGGEQDYDTVNITLIVKEQ
jgi:DNA-binding transcriptional regulator WhiA